MKALRYENGELNLSDINLERSTNEALIQVTTAGICNTDIEIIRGYASFSGTIGHEFVGIVRESPDKNQIGRRVVGEINAGCGVCDLCLLNDPRHCLNRTVLGIHGRDGAFAEYLKLPSNNLLIVPDNVSDDAAVFTEPLAAGCEILDQVKIEKHSRVAVIGDGKLGQLIWRVLATTECNLTLIGKHANKLQSASDAGIKTVTVQDLVIDRANRFDFVVEASGSPDGFALALDLVKPRGTIVLKSTFHGAINIDTSRIVVDEISIVGSRCGRFDKALQLLESGKVDVTPLISSRFDLKDGVKAIEEAQKPGVMKVLLKIES